MPEDVIETALGSADPRRALAAARTLAELPAEQLASALAYIAVALSASSPARQRRAALVAGVLGPAALSLATRFRVLLDSPRWPVREAALHALTRIDPADEQTRDAAGRAVLDRNADVREAAVALLAQHPTPMPAPISDALNHRHPRVRCRALRAAARLAPADNIAHLIAALTHSHRRVRRIAARVLGDMGELAVPAAGRLARCRCDADDTVATAAHDALIALQPHLPTSLCPLLGEENDPIMLLSALSADLPPSLRDDLAQTGADRRAKLVEHGANLDARAEARWLVGWLVDRLVRAHQSAGR